MMKKSAYNAGDPGLIRSLGWEVPLEKGMAPTPVFLPGESHGQRNLVGYSPWGHEELDMTKGTETCTGTNRKKQMETAPLR